MGTVDCRFAADIVSEANSILLEHIQGQDLAIQIIIEAMESWSLTRTAMEVDAKSSDFNQIPTIEGSHRQPLILTFTGPTGVGKLDQFKKLLTCTIY